MNERKFDGKGRIYAQFRPGYPKAFMDWLCSTIGIVKGSVLADIGSGTGILTRQLLAYGNIVYAVEPNDDMRKIAEDDLRAFPNFVSVKATAENTTLPDQSVDLITVAQAFHWFDRERFRLECRRILKQDGKVVLVWNSRAPEDKLVMENDRVNRKWCPGFKGFSGGMGEETADRVLLDFFTGDYHKKVFKNFLHFNKKDFIGRNLSASYAPKEDDENYLNYVRELEGLFDRYSQNEILTMPNWTRCYFGKV